LYTQGRHQVKKFGVDTRGEHGARIYIGGLGRSSHQAPGAAELLTRELGMR